MKTLDYSFDPKCPKCGKSKHVARILEEITLICIDCRVKFKLVEDERLFK